jgi:general secretion pathway protein G
MVRVFRSLSARTALRASSRILARGAPAAPRSPADRRRRGGFTLIEILVVVAVLSVLAALVAPNVFQHLGTAKDAAARSQMEMIGAALDAYRLDNGRYPTTAQGLEALRQEPTLEPRPRNWRGPYLRRELPMDPWGNPYVYVSPGDANPQGYDLVSFGADGALGGEGEDADLRSWD